LQATYLATNSICSLLYDTFATMTYDLLYSVPQFLHTSFEGNPTFSYINDRKKSYASQSLNASI
jgi:hypothetical protein